MLMVHELLELRIKLDEVWNGEVPLRDGVVHAEGRHRQLPDVRQR